MKCLWLAVALLATTLPARASSMIDKEPIEDDYYGWRALALDRERGVAVFIAGGAKADRAVQFQILHVYRDVQKESDFSFDKELMEFLGDCGSRTILQTEYRSQRGDTPTPPPIVRVPPAAVVAPGTSPDLALTALCRDGEIEQTSIDEPYSWAKQRLSASR